jgi:pimeloyl-ACP methyl ester carboxylesterase
MSDNLKIDFSRKAVFMPGSIAPFEVWRDEWLTDFSEDNFALISWWAANLCHVSYVSPAGIGYILKDRGELLRVFQYRNEMAFAFRVKDVVFLVFQGSTGGEDVVLDMSFLPKKDGEHYIHGGFKKALNYLWTDIASFLDEYSSSRFYYCGHSLGGAMAQLSAMRVPPVGVFPMGHYNTNL